MFALCVCSAFLQIRGTEFTAEFVDIYPIMIHRRASPDPFLSGSLVPHNHARALVSPRRRARAFLWHASSPKLPHPPPLPRYTQQQGGLPFFETISIMWSPPHPESRWNTLICFTYDFLLPLCFHTEHSFLSMFYILYQIAKRRWLMLFCSKHAYRLGDSMSNQILKGIMRRFLCCLLFLTLCCWPPSHRCTIIKPCSQR